MERLYELGKRFERLLYSSILVAIACWSTFFLFKTLRGYEYIELADGYNSILTKMERYTPQLNEIEKYLNYMQDIDDRKKITPEIIKKNESENRIRRKVGLPEKKPLNEKKTEQEKLLYDYYLSRINSARRDIGLKEITMIDEGRAYLKEAILSFLDEQKLSVPAWAEIRAEFDKPENNKNINSSMKVVKERFDEYSKMTIKIANIEAPINIPISVGELKSKLPILNIANVLLYCMPIFIVTWFGSLYMTRYFELNALYADGDILHCYPHILNVFTNANPQPSISNYDTIDIAEIICNSKLISDLKFNAKLAAGLRISTIVVFLSAMCVPLYFGIYSYILASKNHELLSFLICMICALINALQIVGFIINEWRFRYYVYVRQSHKAMLINISNHG